MSKQRKERAAAAAGRKSPLRFLEAALWIGVVGLFAWRISPQVGAALGWHAAAVEAPTVSFASLDGVPRDLSSLKGQVVLVNFWATWCPPCRAEMPGFEKVYAAKHADGFTVIGVSMDEAPPAQVQSFIEDHDITYPIAMATADVVSAFGNVNSYPTSFLIDRAGRIRYTVQGIFAEVTLRAAVDRLLEERS